MTISVMEETHGEQRGAPCRLHVVAQRSVAPSFVPIRDQSLHGPIRDQSRHLRLQSFVPICNQSPFVPIRNQSRHLRRRCR